MTVSKEQVKAVVTTFQHPRTGQDLITADVVRALAIKDSNVQLVLDVLAKDAAIMRPLREQLELAIREIEGVSGVTVILTAERGNKPAPELATPRPERVAGVKHIIAVGSGKGGVGKSTISANLALALADLGLRIGLLDADIYGPSQPKMMGATGRPIAMNNTIIPIAAHGIKIMSVGFLMEEDKALVWRGPILANALQQMLHEVAWDPLDILVVDLPPGTGDVQITLTQQTPIDGAIIVTTPQDISLIDARRALDMFHQTGTPILGLIENMSTHICTNCGNEDDVFGHGGGQAEAKLQGIEFLGTLPLTRDVRQASDGGTPIVKLQPGSPHASKFHEMALKISANIC